MAFSCLNTQKNESSRGDAGLHFSMEPQKDNYFRKKKKKKVVAEWEVRKNRLYNQGIFQVLNMRPNLQCGRTERSKPKVV